MTVDQTRSIIDHVREFHEQLGEYYHRLADAADRTRVRLLLDYMSQHEVRLANALAKYEHSAPAKVLETWLQSAEETNVLRTAQATLAELKIDHSASVSQVIEMGIRLSDCVLAVYRDLAERAEPYSVRQVINTLFEMEQRAQQQFARDAERLGDI